MRVLLDACVMAKLGPALRGIGHDVSLVADLPSDPGDAEVLEIARREDRVLITYDKDFGSLVVVERAQHRGVVRLLRANLAEQLVLCEFVLEQCSSDLRAGALVTAEPGRIRIRSPQE
jgi:predicted nuclease of predicted toxin-antitoxin system